MSRYDADSDASDRARVCFYVKSDIASRQDVAGHGGDKPLVWLHGEVKTPPFSRQGRIEAGTLLRRLQIGEKLALPHSRPMPVLGSRCHELRVRDEDVTWRIMYRVDSDAIVIADVFAKKTAATPRQVIDVCRQRLAKYDEAAKEQDE